MIKLITVWVLTVVVTHGRLDHSSMSNFQHTYSTREECLKYSKFYYQQNDGTIELRTYCAPSKIPVVVNK